MHLWETKGRKSDVGVIVINGNKILLGQKEECPWLWVMELPGGILSSMRLRKNAPQRETLEETGLKIKNIRNRDLHQ